MAIVKILKSAQSFKGVRYNTDKVELDRGELMLVNNFEALQAIGLVQPGDYVNYLNAVTNRNRLIKSLQFHAIISCKAREKNKQELTELAQKWLDQMGYAKNPYLLIYHKDTKNNHIHMISSRVDKQGKLIDFGFTYIKAVEILNRLTDHHEKLEAERDVALALSYEFSLKHQFELIMRSLGYTCSRKENKLVLYKFGRRLAEVEDQRIDERTAAYKNNPQRQLAISIIINTHKKTLDAGLYKNKSFHWLPARQRIFTSTLATTLYQRLGIQFFFHQKAGCKPSDFTIIDHPSASVFRSDEIMTLDELVMPLSQMNSPQAPLSWQPDARTLAWDQREWMALHIDIADDVDDEAVYGKNRKRKSNDKLKAISR
ncbi:relaxase/mobilization nuclease domain-containing protein [Mucilaginibacter sabulilitoris]|uniref:Relaxase/mobilization nuclease domain-containing protein n=1 Tax=Mucilaginibacter sabulilitoris TaxID=1173583 RepID=A0ABZ0TS24_9SPHI|nr:relaxase/mobilization nuclease domain-containing protein [Mucilaginibacter sabulilitoris]WPU95761.1 relaxase/mobilization nuclease domain-containing protein [Mucilaginibacter sabulilitoris]